MQEPAPREMAVVCPGTIRDDVQYISSYVSSLVQGFCTPRQPLQLLPGADALGWHICSHTLAMKPSMLSELVLFLKPSR